MDLAKYTELFRTEGREHVAEMSAALLVLEQRGGTAAMSADGADLTADAEVRDAVGAIFRAVHSVKGMGAAMGYTAVATISHRLEALLERVRSGEEPVTRSLVAHLFDETDLLAAEIETAGSSAAAEGSGDSASTDADTAAGAPPTRRERAVRQLRTRHLRIDAGRLDALMTIATELEIARGRLERVMHDERGDMLRSAVTQVARLVTELREQVVTVRMVPVGQVFERFPRLVRETARSLGKEIDFVIDGREIELDRSMLDEIGDPVMHLLRNAIDHGIEPAAERSAAGKPVRGRLTLSAQRESSYVLIRVADDGRGIDQERVLGHARSIGVVDDAAHRLSDVQLLDVLTRPGFSTAERVTAISGRGVGLDAVDATVRGLGGALEIKTIPGRGTAITLRLPLTLVVVPALLARVGDETFAIPITHVLETVELDAMEVEAASRTVGDRWARVRDERFPMVSLRDAVGLPPFVPRHPKGVTVDIRGRRAAVVVDDFVGQQDVVVKRFDPPHGAPTIFAGATILNDGAPALIVDVNRLIAGVD